MESIIILASPIILWLGSNLVREIITSLFYDKKESEVKYKSSNESKLANILFWVTSIISLTFLGLEYKEYKTMDDRRYQLTPKMNRSGTRYKTLSPKRSRALLEQEIATRNQGWILIGVGVLCFANFIFFWWLIVKVQDT